MANRLRVLEPGLLTTVQDLGREHYQQYGMPVSGAMDPFALRMANILVGNDQRQAGLEITSSGLVLSFTGQAWLGLTGADLGARLRGQPLRPWQSFAVDNGDLLEFTAVTRGFRAYLSFAGGLKIPEVMGSRATYLRGGIGGYQGRRLFRGDCIEIVGSSSRPDPVIIPDSYLPPYSQKVEVRAVPGPQEDYFSPAERKKFFSSSYQLRADCDRMGYRLQGPEIKHLRGADIISEGIPLGAVQVPGDGNPIIMLADRQTTGGYAKIATLISVDIPLVAQLKPGDRISFKALNVEEAAELLTEYEGVLDEMESLVGKRQRPASSKFFLVRVNSSCYQVSLEEMD